MKRRFLQLALFFSFSQVAQAQSSGRLIAENSYYPNGANYSSDSSAYMHNPSTIGIDVSAKLFPFLNVGKSKPTQIKPEYLSFKEYEGNNVPANNLYYNGSATINTNGLLTQLTKLFTPSNTGEKSTITYDASNNITKIVDSAISSGASNANIYNYNYSGGNIHTIASNLNGNSLDSFVYNGNNLIGVYQYTTNPNNQLVLYYVTSYYRNASGQMDSVVYHTSPYPYTTPTAFERKSEYKRDAQGRPTVINEYFPQLTGMVYQLYKTDTFMYNGSSILPDSSNAWTFDNGLGAKRQTNWNAWTKNSSNKIVEARAYYSTYPNGHNPYLASKRNFYYEVIIPAAIGNQKNNAQVAAYPNPTSGLIAIEAQNVKAIQLFDINGKPCTYTSKGNLLDISTQANGIYYLQLTTQQGEKSIHTIVKQ